MIPKSSDHNLNFASNICNAIAAALTQVCNTPWQFTGINAGDDGALPSHANEDYCLSFGAPFDGRCLLSVQSGEVGLDSKASQPPVTGDDAGPLFSALRGATESLKGLRGQAHASMPIEVARASAGEWPADRPVQFSGRFHSSEAQLVVRIVPNDALLSALQQPANKSFFAVSISAQQPQANLDLVMDVALNVTLRFGRRQLPLREIVDLTSGSVVELDRQVDEPVELVLDGRVIARGEAVVIDGNYGMRVTQIVHPLLNV